MEPRCLGITIQGLALREMNETFFELSTRLHLQKMNIQKTINSMRAFVNTK